MRTPPEHPALIRVYKYSFILTASLWNTTTALRQLKLDRAILQAVHTGGLVILTTATIAGSRKLKTWQEELYQFIRRLTSPDELRLIESDHGTQFQAQFLVSAAETLAGMSLIAHTLLSMPDRSMSEESYELGKIISSGVILLTAAIAFILFYIATTRAENLLIEAYSFSLREAERAERRVEEDLRPLLAAADNRVVPEAPEEPSSVLTRRLGS